MGRKLRGVVKFAQRRRRRRAGRTRARIARRHAQKRADPLYGIGYTNALLSYLESGSIRRLIVEDDFAMGHSSLKSAVDAIEKPQHGSMVKSSHATWRMRRIFTTNRSGTSSSRSPEFCLIARKC